MRKNSCIACRYNEAGVKSRKAFTHTCGKYITHLPNVNNEDVITSSPLILREDGNETKNILQGVWKWFKNFNN